MGPKLQRRLTTFDLALVTIGIVVGSGIFRTPAAVAQRAHVPALILVCWLTGGAVAIVGAFVFAELAARRPVNGGLYGYLKDAYHPIVAFLFGWCLMLVVGTGSNAAAAVLFAGYVTPLLGVPLDGRFVAAGTLVVLAGINLLGVRQGSTFQNITGILKVGAIVILGVVCVAGHSALPLHTAAALSLPPAALVAAFGVAMLPVLFTYNGFQNATLISAETVTPERTIPRALLLGVAVIVTLYLLVNVGYLRVLGVSGLAASPVPAAAAMQAVVGPVGAKLIALTIAISTLGYLSTCMLVHPRVYYQMAADGLFFRQLAWINPKTQVPAVAIAIQAVIASAIALSGTYEQIVNWVVLPMWLFSILAAIALFIFRTRDANKAKPSITVPGHPYTTGAFIAVLAGILLSEIVIYPLDTLYGVATLATGAIVFAGWRRWSRP